MCELWLLVKPANSGPGPSAANVNGSRKDHTATALPLCGKPQKKLSKVSQVKVCACACPQVPANSDFDIRVMDPVRQGEGVAVSATCRHCPSWSAHVLLAFQALFSCQTLGFGNRSLVPAATTATTANAPCPPLLLTPAGRHMYHTRSSPAPLLPAIAIRRR